MKIRYGYGSYARHRSPHPMQQQAQPPQQQAQYPAYQTPTDGMYGMADQHAVMGGMSDLNAWNNTQPTPYPGYSHSHANVSQPPRQTQAQAPAAYRQHMSYQQDPQKMQYPTQQGMMSGMIQQQSYPNQQAQQRVPQQHYGQSAHPMYSNPPQTTQNTQGYANYGPTAAIPHQTARSAQHVGYGHTQMDQTAAYQHYQVKNDNKTVLYCYHTFFDCVEKKKYTHLKI